jgi:Putative bacterial sensory transduction regulator
MQTYQTEPVVDQNQINDQLNQELIQATTAINHVELIETVIDSLDQENTAMVSQGDRGHIWKFKYGSVEVFVQLTGITDEDTFTVWAIVLSLPAKNESELFRKLLEKNWKETFESRFAIANNQVAVIATRTVAELSPGEISRAITVVATVADNNDDALQAEFGKV